MNSFNIAEMNAISSLKAGPYKELTRQVQKVTHPKKRGIFCSMYCVYPLNSMIATYSVYIRF